MLKKIGATVLIIAGIAVILNGYFVKTILILFGVITFLFILRLLADLFWYGRDKGEW
jgi:hypothetical protein